MIGTEDDPMIIFQLMTKDEIQAVAACLDGIGRIVDVENGLRELRAHILTLLWLVERNPDIDAVADILYQAAETTTRGPLRGIARPAHWRDLNEALARFQSLLQNALPSERARQASLVTREP